MKTEMMEKIKIIQFADSLKSIHLILLMLTILSGVGSGTLDGFKNSDLYESIHDKSIRNPFGHISDVDYTISPSKQITEEKLHNKNPRRSHKHHRGHLDFLELHKSLLDFEQDANIEERKFNDFLLDIENVKQNPYYGSTASSHARKFDVTFINDQHSWPRFRDIEILAGVSGWKKERWKESTEEDSITEKPKSTRTTKFTYRRVPSTNGSKKNAIIAVSAILQDPTKPEN